LRRLLSLFAALAIALGSLALSAPASPAAAACTNSKVVWYEGANYSGTAHTFTLSVNCTASLIENMTNYVNSDGHACLRGGIVFPASSLNDCASSWKITATCHYHVAMYANTNGSGLLQAYSVNGTRSTMPFGWEDSLSSIKFWYTSACVS